MKKPALDAFDRFYIRHFPKSLFAYQYRWVVRIERWKKQIKAKLNEKVPSICNRNSISKNGI